MNACERLHTDLKAYLDGELPLVRAWAVRWHLAHCAAAREEKKAMKQMSNDLRAGELDSLEPTLRAKILTALASAPKPDAPADAAQPVVPKWKRRPMLLWGGAAAAILVWFALYPSLTHRSSPSDEMQPTEKNMSVSAPSTPAAGKSQVAMAPKDSDTFIRKGYNNFYNDPQDKANYGGAAKSPALVAPSASAPAERKWTWPLKAQKQEAQDNAASDADSTLTPIPKPLPGTSADVGSSEAQKARAQAKLPSYQRAVHREASMTLQVDKLEEKSDTVEQMVNELGGYVASNELTTGSDNVKSASLSTRVPVTQFDSFLSRVAKLGEVKAKSVTGEDVTEEMSDTKQSSRTLADEIQEIQGRLNRKHSKQEGIEDREELSNLKVQLAEAKGRMELLKKMAALATITIDLHEKPAHSPTVQKSGGFLDEMSDTAHDAAHTFMTAVRLPILLLVWLMVYAPVWILLLLAYRYAVRVSH